MCSQQKTEPLNSPSYNNFGSEASVISNVLQASSCLLHNNTTHHQEKSTRNVKWVTHGARKWNNLGQAQRSFFQNFDLQQDSIFY